MEIDKMASINPHLRLHRGLRSPRRQRGAVLYVALIMLILLAMLGIVGMQVAGMQERMVASYRAVNLAFQNAEGIARLTECGLEELVNREGTTSCPTVTPDQICDDDFDPLDWAESQSLTAVSATNTRLIGPCISGNTALDMGGPINEDPNPIYQVTAYATDGVNLGSGSPGTPSSSVAVDTIFRP